EDQGGLDENESQLIRAAIEFNELEVGDILTPRVDLSAVPDTATFDELAALFAETGYSRIPVYHESIDSIIGVIHEKDFYSARYHGATDISGFLGKVLCTTDNTKISDLMRILQKSKLHLVVVVDEYGGTEGIVTLEDILEELVGEIWDEHDEVIEQFQREPDGSYRISCSADLTDLYDLFSITGKCDYATVSGWVLEEIGRIPEEGDTFTYENLDVTVTRVDHRRVLEIRVVVQPEPAETAEGHGKTEQGKTK
ncbi:MAG: hemolysin family protein, partial [Oscillospiraceae bacterium]